MAERPSVKDILARARAGGPAKPGETGEPAPAAPADEPAAGAAAPEPVEAAPAAVPEPAAPPADVPTPSKLGRPLTLKEKLAAARAGGAPSPAAAAAPKAKAHTPPPEAEAAPAAEEAAAAAPAPAEDVPTPSKLGRPLTLKEKLAAARAGGTPAPAAGAPAKPAAAKPAAAKPAAGAPAKAAAARTLPPLEKMTDPRDLAEALRQTGAKKAKEVAAQAAAAAPPKAAPAAKPAHKEAKPQTVPPKPSKKASTASAAAVAQAERRGFMIGSLFFSFVALGWTAFAAASAALTTLCVRFMFPNVLAEPPSTIKIGLSSNFEKEDVNERFKAEWGFWIVRSSRYNDADILYAIKSVCTHLGCPPNWLAGEQKFKCPCHGSGFYITGINFEGPAPRPLERFKVTQADDGQIVVDKSQIFQQELGQWEDPDSFIVV
jgi:cytochrome b6-f complex iron-sulfur subunit